MTQLDTWVGGRVRVRGGACGHTGSTKVPEVAQAARYGADGVDAFMHVSQVSIPSSSRRQTTSRRSVNSPRA
jgi:hypothetical protein